MREKIRLSALKALIEREEAEARDKIANAWQWGDVGSVQAWALAGCVEILMAHRDAQGELGVQACLAALRSHEDSIKASPRDKDGYGGATVAAVIKGLTELALMPSAR